MFLLINASGWMNVTMNAAGMQDAAALLKQLRPHIRLLYKNVQFAKEDANFDSHEIKILNS